ncbi:MAG: 2-oxoacid:acceptor oxidoreductase family protein [Thermoplasmata archaeon]|nr:2-oxoacid:acceptor oxidoreductase family protein [Thermoplasmata archaeon]
MYEIRFHGRGGQGAVTAANALAVAAAMEGMYVQAFPVFGVERRGAPVAAFVRIDEKEIDIRSQIYNPDIVVVLDMTLLGAVNVTAGLKKGGILIFNTKKKPGEFSYPDFKVATVDATEIAVRNGLGTQTNPIVNTAILGAYARAVGNVKLESIIEAVKQESPVKKDENAKAVKDAFENTVKGW